MTASDARVPGVAAFRRCGTQPLAELFQIVGHGEARDVFHVLVAQWARNTQTQRPAVGHWKLTAVHAVSDESLRMQGIGHIDAVPPVRLYREVDDESGSRQNSHHA